MTETSSFRRRFRRFPLEGTARLTTPDGRTLDTRLLDLSLQGVCVAPPADHGLILGDPVRVSLALSPEIGIEMDAVVANAADGRLGCACRHIDLESLAALKRFVELNLGDADLLERELSALMTP